MRRVALVSVFVLGAFGLAVPPASANQAPVGVSDSYTMQAGQVLEIPAPGLLGNDSDPDGDLLTIYPDALPGGWVDLRLDGSFTFTPPADFSGLYSFDYYAFDGLVVNGCCAHVYISVYPTAVAVGDRFGAVNTATRVVPAPGVLANDTGDSAVLVRPPDHGRLDLAADGSFRYRADAGYVGVDVFTYRVTSGAGQSPPVRVALLVRSRNSVPVPAPDAYVTVEDSLLSAPAPGVLGNDTDADGDRLTAEIVTYPYGDSFELYPDGSFEYSPPLDFDSVVSFTYRVSDGFGVSAPTTVTIDIRAQSDPPEALDDEYLLGGRRLDVPAPGVLANDTDTVEGDTLRAVLVTAPTLGVVRLATDGSFSYLRPAGVRGDDSFSYRVEDSGGAVGNTATVTLYAPVAAAVPVGLG